jgi:chondroitin AC lyase
MIDRLLTGMDATDPSHALEYATAAAEGSQPAGGGATVDWNFFRSDMIVHRRPGFYVSVKLCSNRVIGEETVNGENLRGRYMADGATFLYQTSADYRDIFPVWDWRRVPGVTCATSGTTLAPVGKMATDFAGGASDGAYGVEGLDYRRDGVTAKKGWFFFDEGVVCLGAGISGSNARTSVDQRRADGIAETNLGPLGLGVEACSGVTWVLDGSMGYLFAKPTDLSAGTQSQAGSWKDVYSAGSPTPITADIFSIWIDHTAQPGSYAYTMLPGATVEKLNAYTAIPPMEIVSNTPDIQAVRAAGVTEALFYKAGQLKLPNLTISTSAPCALILRNGAISVADPTQKQTSLTITINDREWSSPLPQGDLAGSTVQSTPW